MQKFKSIQFKLLLTSSMMITGTSFAATRYLVELNSPSLFADTQFALRKALSSPMVRKNVFGKSSLVLPKILGTTAQVSQTLNNLNMIVVETNNPADIAALKLNPNVSLVEQEQFFPLMDPTPKHSDQAVLRYQDPASEIPWGIEAVRAPDAWKRTETFSEIARSSSMGQGARVVVLDTGVDRDHPDLKDRIETGRDFVNHATDEWLPESAASNLFLSMGNDLDIWEDPDSESSNPPPYEYFDQEGHGTHVSGTIAGEFDGKGVVGVAPKAKILMGRVCGKFGCSTLAIINGINWAISQKADLVSMSLGGPSGSQGQAKAMQAAEDANVVTVAASGNSGTPSVSFPAAYETCIAVGAVDSNLKKAQFSQWGPELDIMGPGVDVQSTVPQGTGRSSKVSVKRNGRMEEVPSTSFMGAPELSSPLSGVLAFAGLGKTADFAGADFKGKIALISRGEISFADKVKNAIAAGARGALIYNNAPGLMSGALTQDGSIVAIPVAMIEKTVGEALRDSLSNGGTEEASLSTARTDYAALSGTSMATPHVAGVVALVKAANPKLTPAEVRFIIQRSANILDPSPDNQYGAGMVNADVAVEGALLMRKD